MARPSPAIIGSLALHAGVGALLFIVLTQQPPEPRPLVSSVPVSIISDTITVEAAPGENPTDEVVPEEETAPPPAPEPVPPPTPRPTPVPKTTPPRPPQRPVTPQREEPSLNTEDLVRDGRGRPDRPRPRPRPPSGDRGLGTEATAIGQAGLQSIAAQITPNWNPPCHLDGVENLSVSVQVRMTEDGRVVGSPQIVRPRSDATSQIVQDSLLRAIGMTSRYRMPAGYEEQTFIIVFRLQRACSR